MTDGFTLDSDSREVLLYLRQPLILVAETLEASIPIVLESIQRQGLDFSPFLFSTNIRCHLKKALLSGGYNPQDADDLVPVAVNLVSNDGIDFEYRALRLKVRKGEELPPAISENMEQFYSQQTAFSFARETNRESPLRNLVVLWDYNFRTSAMSMLLVAPRNKKGALLWQLPIPAPSEWITPGSIIDTQDQDLDIGNDDAAAADSDGDEPK